MRSSTKIVKLAVLAAIAFLLAFPMSVSGQNGQSEIKGTVSDESGSPLPGATIQIKGTTNGTSTDLDGHYIISANEGDVLVYTFIGMFSKEVKVGKSAVVNVILEEDANLLDEAVSIGYGTQKRTLLTTSITKVSSAEFENSPQQNALAQLQGKVPGLRRLQGHGEPASHPARAHPG